MSEIRFKPNPKAAEQLADSAAMRKAMLHVAGQGADEVRRRAPQRVLAPQKARVYAAALDDGAEIVVRSPIWHWFEYGTRLIPPQPYIRPAVQQILSRYGGRFQSK